MSHFLWVEDFETSPEVTADNVFGDLFGNKPFSDDERELKRYIENYGVSVELNLQDGLEAITPDLDKKFDYIILDIDLPAYDGDLNQEVLGLLSEFEGYQTLDDEAEDEALRKQACHSLKSIAGFYLYTKLVVELGFPKQHILFCSNHGENTETIQNAFKAAKIKLPKIYQKSDVEVKNWVKESYENPYSRLRRGVIEACKYLKSIPESNCRFKDFIKDDEKKPSIEDIHNYLDVLAGFLPLKVPENPQTIYKLFIRTLSHVWEAAEPIQEKEKKYSELSAFFGIMKITRNWSAHGSVFQEIKAEDLAYLFIINMRAMFELGDEALPFEKYLLRLFENPVEDGEMKKVVGRSHEDRSIPLAVNYASMLKNSGNTWQAIDFQDTLNRLQRNKSDRFDNDFFIKGLYQLFWFLTSKGRVYIPNDNLNSERFKALQYQFMHFDYKKTNYIFEIARHIYGRSFPEILIHDNPEK
jgi:hypothetical protein